LYGTCYGAGAGVFEEADSAGCASRATVATGHGVDAVNEATLGPHKLDYIFLSGGHWSTARAEAFDAVAGLSDHRALWATVSFHG
jgi:endonuclease/exonuclease/phosphatase family metal-dependent hydrolase